MELNQRLREQLEFEFHEQFGRLSPDLHKEVQAHCRLGSDASALILLGMLTHDSRENQEINMGFWILLLTAPAEVLVSLMGVYK